MKLETFKELVENIQKIHKDYDAFSDLKFDVFDLNPVELLERNFQLMIWEVFNETQADFFSWWVYENHLGNGLFSAGSIGSYSYKGRKLYSGTDIKKVYKELMSLKDEN